MAFPGFLVTPTTSPGLEVTCPELGGAYWYEGFSEPVPDRLIVYDGLTVTVRTDVTEDGRAIAAAAVSELGAPGLQVEMILQGVWDSFLVDSFEGDICPGIDPSDPYTPSTPFFLGRGDDGSIIRLSHGHEELAVIVPGFMRPNVVAPGGIGARCLFQNVYLGIEGNTGGWCKVTPVIDGEVLTDEAMAFAIPSDGSTREVRRFEIPLTRKYEPDATELSREGIIGTWFTVQIEIVDAFGCGRLEPAGVEVEFQVLEESIPGQVYTGESVNYPSRIPPQAWFLGGIGADLYRGDQGTDDGGEDIPIYLQTNEVAPYGVGGEGLFQNVYVAVTRDNPTGWTVTLTPVLD
ncbi:MAG: hypothetical protein KAJ42_14470, partial [Gemmatimonadetes bacterium]|nr:hypothetical protein [Gemmatimonadota bacterium]